MLPVLRLLTGLFLVGGAVWFGAYFSPFVIVPLTLIFTISFGLGRWRAWVYAKREGVLRKAIAGQAMTVLVQGVLVGVLYLIGRGVASILGVSVTTMSSGVPLLAFGSIAIGLGAAIAWMEWGALDTIYEKMEAAETEDVYGAVEAPSIPVTEESFFQSHYHGHRKMQMNPETGNFESQGLDEKLAYPNEETISDHESRLGIRLPERLRRLYLRQNGGSRMSLYAPCDKPMHNAEEGWINVFPGYDDCYPLENLHTVADSVEAYADENYQPEEFPTGCREMVILAQWYRETLFLDFRGGEIPRVGFVDFDGFDDLRAADWEGSALWWDDFDSFFACLKRRPGDDGQSATDQRDA